jgi:hypothetical protein
VLLPVYFSKSRFFYELHPFRLRAITSHGKGSLPMSQLHAQVFFFWFLILVVEDFYIVFRLKHSCSKRHVFVICRVFYGFFCQDIFICLLEVIGDSGNLAKFPHFTKKEIKALRLIKEFIQGQLGLEN